MSLQTFFDNFALLTDAPNGVQKVRELILQLAVEGKLLAGRSTEEPAIELLKRIRYEKDRAVGNRQLRKVNLSSVIERNEVPCELPPRWEWVRLGELCKLENGDRSKNYPSRDELVSNGIPFINAGHLKTGLVSLESMNYISPRSFDRLKSGKIRDGDILFCLRGSLGKSALVKGISQGAIASSLVIIRLIGDLNKQFVLNYLFSPLAAQMIRRFDNGTAQPNLSSADLSKFIFPLAPIEEQNRIVAKVDELMRLCDELETRQQARRESRVRLNGAILAPLNNTASFAPEESERAIVRLADNFDVLYDTADTVGKLRSTILQLAVQGKLVPQNPGDVPADLVLAEMAKRKKELSLRKPLRLPPVSKFETLFPLPQGWAWAQWGAISDWITYGFTRPMEHITLGIPIVTAKNVIGGHIDFSDTHKTSPEAYEKLSDKDRPQIGDILLTKDGTIGRVAIVETESSFCVNQSVAVIWLRSCHLVREYLRLVIQSEWTQRPLWERAEGAAIKHISVVDFACMVLPVAPIEEQERIVAKVNQLMELCDELEAKLRQAEADSEKLMKAAVGDLLASIRDTAESEPLSAVV